MSIFNYCLSLLWSLLYRFISFFITSFYYFCVINGCLSFVSFKFVLSCHIGYPRLGFSILGIYVHFLEFHMHPHWGFAFPLLRLDDIRRFGFLRTCFYIFIGSLFLHKYLPPVMAFCNLSLHEGSLASIIWSASILISHLYRRRYTLCVFIMWFDFCKKYLLVVHLYST